MKRNLLAIAVGVACSFLLLSVIGFIIVYFQVKPFYSFLTAAMLERKKEIFAIGQQVFYSFYLFIFPSLSLISGFVAGIIANNKEYLIGILSIVPIFLSLSFALNFSDVIFCFASFMFPVVIGVSIAVFFKKKKNSRVCS